MAEAKTADEKKLARALTRDFGIASFKHNRWAVELDENQTLDDALRPDFWSNVSDVMLGHDVDASRALGDIIEVRKRDSGLYAELIVREIGKGYVKVGHLRMSEPPVVDIPETSPLTTRWNPGVGKRCHEVIRKADKSVMASGFQTKQKAADWINDHVKAMAA